MKLTKQLILLLSLYFFSSGYGQEVYLGIKIGSNSSKLLGGDSEINEHNFLTSPDYGVFIDYGISKRFSLQAELNLTPKNFSYSSKELLGASWSGKASFDYLSFGLLPKYSFGKKLKIFANAGPVINILVGGGNYNFSTWGSHKPSVTNTGSQNIKSGFNKITFGVLAGVGMSYNITSNFSLLGELRSSYDLSKSVKNEGGFKNKEASEKLLGKTPHFLNIMIQAGIAYKF